MHINGAYGIAFSHDDRLVAIALRDKTIAMYDIETKEVIYKLGAGHYNEIKTVAFTPDDKHLVTGPWDNSLILWDLEIRQSEKQFVGHDRGVYAADISSDGKLLLSGSRDHTCILWDIDTGKMLNRYVGDSACNSVRFTDEGFICGFDSGRVDVIKFGYGSNTICLNNGYKPRPIRTDTIELPDELIELSDELAKNVHGVWAEGRFSDGWHLGSHRNDLLKTHPSLIPYE